MKNTNNIGLDAKTSQITAVELNDLLSNYQVFCMNLRGFHWDIKGKKFFELHLKFEELYNDALIIVDEIVERVLTPGATPMYPFENILRPPQLNQQKILLMAR